MIAAVSAVVLLLVMFIFTWFNFGAAIDEATSDLAAQAGVSVADTEIGLNAWESFGFIDIILLITILVAIGLAVMAANAQSHNLPVAGSALVAGLGILSVLLILFRIISPPDFGVDDFGFGDAVETTRSVGVFLGLIAAAGIAYGGYVGMQEEGTSFRAQGDRLGSRGAPPPPRDNQPPPAV